MLFFIICILVILIYSYTFPFLTTERLPHLLTPYSTYKGIPLIIHRTYSYRYINRRMFYNCHQKWVDINPGYQIIWFNNKRVSVMKEFGPTIMDAYQKLKPIAFKTDLWRLCVLYKYGGIYVDAYAVPYISMNRVIDNSRLKEKDKFISVLDCPQSGGYIHNGFIIVTPRHPFIMQCIQDIIHNVKTLNYTNHVLGVTGPKCLELSIRKVIQSQKKFTVGYNKFNFSFYLLRFIWGPSQYIKDKDVIVLSKKYNIFHYIYNKVIRKKSSYSYMWKNNDIYA